MRSQNSTKQNSIETLEAFLSSPTLRYIGVGLWALLLAVIPFNIVYHFQPEYAYVDGYFVNYLDFVVHIVDIAVVLVLVWIVAVERVWKFRMVRISWVLLGLFWVVHNLMFRDPVVLYGSLRILLYGLCLVGGIAWFGCMLLGKKKDKVMQKNVGVVFLSVILLSGIVQSIIALAQFFTNRMIGIDFLGESVIQIGGYATSSVYLSDGLHLRAYGTFPHPNVLGGFLVAVLAVVLYGSGILKGKWRALVLATMVVVLAGIVVTWSRMSLVLAVVLGLIWLGNELFTRYGKKVLTGFVVGIVLAGLAGGMWVMNGTDVMSSSLRERFVTQSQSSDVSMETRRELNERAMEMFKKSPLFGVGISRFVLELADEPVYSESGIRVMQPAHNVPLLVLAELGIFGVSCLLAVAVTIFRKTKWSLYALTVLLFYIGVGLVDHYAWTLPQGIALAFIFVTGCLLYKRWSNSKRML